MLVPWPSMIGMAMCDDGALDRTGRVDEELAGLDIKPASFRVWE
jgi:hypothetical protein